MKRLLIVSLLVISFWSCKKEKEPVPTPPISANTDGFGNSQKQPTGSTFVLPSGITFNGPLEAVYTECTTDLARQVNSGTLVQLSVPVKNNTNNLISATSHTAD